MSEKSEELESVTNQMSKVSLATDLTGKEHASEMKFLILFILSMSCDFTIILFLHITQ